MAEAKAQGTGPLLRALQLTRRFGGLAAVNGVSLDLHVGEVHAVIGAIAFTLLKELFQSEALLGPLASHWQLSLGLAIIAFVALLPKGLIGIGARMRGRRNA